MYWNGLPHHHSTFHITLQFFPIIYRILPKFNATHYFKINMFCFPLNSSIAIELNIHRMPMWHPLWLNVIYWMSTRHSTLFKILTMHCGNWPYFLIAFTRQKAKTTTLFKTWSVSKYCLSCKMLYIIFRQNKHKKIPLPYPLHLTYKERRNG